MLICRLPCRRKVNFQYILAQVADLDTVRRNGSAKDNGKEVVFDVTLFQIGYVEACDTINIDHERSVLRNPAYRRYQGP
jgi:hypothetical protein